MNTESRIDADVSTSTESINEIIAHPATPNCYRLLERGDHVLLGVSPFNTQFTRAYLTRIIKWAAVSFEQFNVLVPGERETALMLQAVGTPAGRAIRKARRELNRISRLVQSGLVDAGVACSDTTLLRISDFDSSFEYRSLVALAQETYCAHKDFRESCLQMSRLAVLGRQRVITPNGRDVEDLLIELATAYIFAEIPFFVNTADLLRVRSSVLAYHRPWPIGGLLFSRCLPISVNERQGYVVLQSRDAPNESKHTAAA